MGKFTSLLLSNILVVLGFILANSIYKDRNFFGEILLFLWGASIFIIIIIAILILTDNFILKSKKWQRLIFVETILLGSIFVLLRESLYFILILGITQSIKYSIYNRYINKGEKDE